MGHQGTLRVALAFAVLLASLSLVVRRQSGAYEALRALDGLRTRRAVVESERSRLIALIQQLESRARIAGVAARWWGMRVPASDEEFVIMLRPGGGGSRDERPPVVAEGGNAVSDAAAVRAVGVTGGRALRTWIDPVRLARLRLSPHRVGRGG